MPKAVKTGTTIIGIVFKDGVILGADTRATEGNIVAEKDCEKIHYIAPNIYCCGAGTAADTEKTTKMISSQLELHRLATGRPARLHAANRLISQMLFKYQGYVGAALILGGVDLTGPHLFQIYPHGSSNQLPYVTMGSGSLAAMSILECRWKKDMELAEAKELVRDSVSAGIFNDLGSGSNVDICVITKDSTEYKKPYYVANIKGERQGKYRFKRGSTAVLTTKVIPIHVEETIVKKHDAEAMDTSI